jgi:regulator of CtrA degradation
MTQADIVWEEAESAISFGRNFVRSEAFHTLFREGMDLVEEAAAYLDGDGREQSRQLDRHGALLYASESMRLTTRLMQVASWLLVQRAVAEGEITSEQASQEKTRVRLGHPESVIVPENITTLPETLQGLMRRSQHLHRRILHLDRVIDTQDPLSLLPESPVAVQQWLLQEAFQASRAE